MVSGCISAACTVQPSVKPDQEKTTIFVQLLSCMHTRLRFYLPMQADELAGHFHLTLVYCCLQAWAKELAGHTKHIDVSP